MTTEAGTIHGVLFGGSEPLVAASTTLGRKLALVRTYYTIGESFPDTTDRALMENGTSLVVSLDLPPGMSYTSVTSGQEDGTIRNFLETMAASARRYRLQAIYFSFEHEPDTTKHGSDPTGFVSAWDHVYALATRLNVDWRQGGPIHWVWILTHLAYTKNEEQQYWPGPSRVDIVAEDAYNTSGCKKAAPGSAFVASTSPVSPSDLFGQALSFAESKEKPFFITEWGSVPGPTATARAKFIRAVGVYVLAHPDIYALLYWDGHGHNNGCDYNINKDRATVAALAQLGRTKRFEGAPAH